MSTILTMLPLDEVKDILDSFTKEVTKVAVVTGDETGLFIEYIEDRRIHTKLIKPVPCKES